MWLTYTLLASLGFGIGATMQKHGMAKEFPKLSFGKLRQDCGPILRTMFSNWVWLLGIACNLVACLLMTLAIQTGEISVVLPLLNISLIASIAIGVIVLRERLLRQEWAGALTLILGSALVSASGMVGSPVEQVPQTQPSALTLLWVFLGCGGGVGLLLFAGRMLRKELPLESTLAIIAGLLFGMGGVVVKLTTIYLSQDQTGPGSYGAGDLLASVMLQPATWVALGLGLLGFIFFQIAFSHGRVSVVVPMVSIAALVPPLAAGIIAFGEAVGVLRVAGILVVTVGVALLLVDPKPVAEAG